MGAEDPLGDTGASAAVYTALIRTPGTTAEIAVTACVGRSTAGKTLVALEERGLATRTPGEHQDGRRLPDRWHPAQIPTATESGSETAVAVNAHSPHLGSDTTCEAGSTAESAAPVQPEAGDPEGSTAAQYEATASGPDHTTDVLQGEQPPKHQPAPVQDTAATAPVPPPANGQKTRLAPGALRRMVIDHLTAHPGKAFTATGISRAIEKSSGAIANCLATLVAHGLAE